LPPYTEEQFLSCKALPKLKEETVHTIVEQVWNTRKDVRDVISLGKLIRRNDGPAEIQAILNSLTRYGGKHERLHANKLSI
jgi:hypothetical protein